MSGHQEYQCPVCGYAWETLGVPDCPRCRELAEATCSPAVGDRFRIKDRRGKEMVVEVIETLGEACEVVRPDGRFPMVVETAKLTPEAKLENR